MTGPGVRREHVGKCRSRFRVGPGRDREEEGVLRGPAGNGGDAAAVSASDGSRAHYHA